MMKQRGPEHRSIMVIDTAGSAKWHNQAQLQAREVLSAAVRAAFRHAGIEWANLAAEDRGDGMILLVPASVSKLDLLDPVVPRLAQAIGEHNAAVDPAFRIRLRIAVHAGELHHDQTGWVGSDLNTACRLVNGEAAYEQLNRRPEADLVLVVSELIYHGVVRHRYRDIDPSSYRPVVVRYKEVDTRAWIRSVHMGSPIRQWILKGLAVVLRRWGHAKAGSAVAGGGRERL
jgi:hypothetical protein